MSKIWMKLNNNYWYHLDNEKDLLHNVHIYSKHFLEPG